MIELQRMRIMSVMKKPFPFAVALSACMPFSSVFSAPPVVNELEAKVAALESLVAEQSSRINALESENASKASEISTNASNITANANDISTLFSSRKILSIYDSTDTKIGEVLDLWAVTTLGLFTTEGYFVYIRPENGEISGYNNTIYYQSADCTGDGYVVSDRRFDFEYNLQHHVSLFSKTGIVFGGANKYRQQIVYYLPANAPLLTNITLYSFTAGSSGTCNSMVETHNVFQVFPNSEAVTGYPDSGAYSIPLYIDR
jgi:hypothetical protein